ncbi:hypothetical protein HII31_05298 [Pseudocercospora fuligena]|uniref:Uncharacterized protein n=1 Tax=Pseudocercospora fuligena TaxID=685502 RepID=A0A8H6VM96_9PEZI|nr:hypothetical protein HII31_05298 [Pseudocercospora fuligena]
MFVKLGAAALCFLAAVNAAPKEDIVDLEVDNNLIARQSPNPAHAPPTIPGLFPDPGLQQDTIWHISNIYIGCGVASVGCSYQFDIDSDESFDVPGIHVQCFANRLPVPLIRSEWRSCQLQQIDDTQGSNVQGVWAAVTLNPRQNTGNILVGLSFQGQDQFGRYRNHFYRGSQAASFRYLTQSATQFDIYPDE